MKTRTFYFFPHPLSPSRNPDASYPGRFPFTVTATKVDERGVSTGEVRIFADGFNENTIGPNQDPCVLSHPIGPVHSFCRIERNTPDHYAVGDQLLSRVVRPNDVVIYGSVTKNGSEMVCYVDTVLVVAKPVKWTTAQRQENCRSRHKPGHRQLRYRRAKPSLFAKHLLGVEDPCSDVIRYNLADGDPTGAHCCTSLDPYYIILGKTTATSAALAALETSFCPIVDQGSATPLGLTQKSIAANDWKRFAEFLTNVVGSATFTSGNIRPFPDTELGVVVTRAIVSSSGAGEKGTVAIPPFRMARDLYQFNVQSGESDLVAELA